jgi:hypothetical protein
VVQFDNLRKVTIASVGDVVQLKPKISFRRSDPLHPNVTLLRKVSLTWVGHPDVAESPSGGQIYVTFEAFGDGWQGIVQATVVIIDGTPLPPTLVVVADTETSIPGTKHSDASSFRCLGSQAIASSGDVVFFGSNCSSVDKSFSRRSRHEQRSDSHSGDVYPGVFRWSAGKLSVIADPSTPVPGGTASEKFIGFSDPTISHDGTAAFVALTTGGEKVIAVSTPDKQLSIAASTASPVTKFTDLPFVPSIDGNGTVLFYGAADNNRSGVYSATRSKPNASNWKPVAELTLADKVEGQSLVYIGFGNGAYNHETGTFAAYLVLANDVEGIWTFSRKGLQESPIIMV